MPGEERLGRHRKAEPGSAGEDAVQRSQEDTVGGLVGRTSDLASEHGDLVAQGKQLDLIGALRAHHDGDKLEYASDTEVDESPKAATRPVPSHRRTVAHTIRVRKALVSDAIGYSEGAG